MSKILLVEDDHFLQELYKNILSDQSYTIELASDGEEAYEKIKQGGYDLILLDIMLPKMDGIEVMKKITKETTVNPNKKVVFLTNLDHQVQIHDAEKLGDGYLIKSDLNPDMFLEKVKEFLK